MHKLQHGRKQVPIMNVGVRDYGGLGIAQRTVTLSLKTIA